MTELVKEMMKDNEHILNIINKGGSIEEILAYPSNRCSLIANGQIKLEEKNLVGAGVTSAAYVITLPGMGIKKYAMKRSEFDMAYFKDVSKKDVMRFLNERNLTLEKIKPF